MRGSRRLTQALAFILSIDLPSEVARALEPLASELGKSGYAPSSFLLSKSFGDFQVTFSRGAHAFSIARDRGQFLVNDVAQEELEAFGLLRVFATPVQLRENLLAWLSTHQAPV